MTGLRLLWLVFVIGRFPGGASTWGGEEAFLVFLFAHWLTVCACNEDCAKHKMSLYRRGLVSIRSCPQGTAGQPAPLQLCFVLLCGLTGRGPSNVASRLPAAPQGVWTAYYIMFSRADDPMWPPYLSFREGLQLLHGSLELCLKRSRSTSGHRKHSHVDLLYSRQHHCFAMPCLRSGAHLGFILLSIHFRADRALHGASACVHTPAATKLPRVYHNQGSMQFCNVDRDDTDCHERLSWEQVRNNGRAA